MVTPPISKGQNIAAWVISVLLGVAFVMSGGMKLSGAPEMVANFQRWGYPGFFIYVTGAIELVSALLLFMPRTAAYGAALLIPTMVGAVLTHLTHDEMSHAPVPLVLGALAAVVLFLRRGTILALLGKPVKPATA